MLTVVKVGGSLYSWPELGPRLAAWLNRQTSRILLVPGGGAAADVIRELDKVHGLGEEAAHWLALHSLTLNAHFLESLLQAPVCASINEIGARVVILDVVPFMQEDEGRPGSLPHTWAATSDSVAARVAVVAGADRLVLLKSAALTANTSWHEAGRLGYVDSHFARLVSQSPRLAVSAVHFQALAGES